MKNVLQKLSFVLLFVSFVSSVVFLTCAKNPVENGSTINTQDGSSFIQEGGDGDPPPPPPDPPPPSAPPPFPPEPDEE